MHVQTIEAIKEKIKTASDKTNSMCCPLYAPTV